MSSPTSRRAAVTVVAVCGVLAGAAGAYAAVDGPDTTTAVSPRVVISAPDRSPVTFAGVAKVRAGDRLPAGRVVVARDVRITRGAEAAYAALRMSCPRGKTWRAGAGVGDIVVSVLDRVVSDMRSVLVMAAYDIRETVLGESAAGTIYALCR